MSIMIAHSRFSTPSALLMGAEPGVFLTQTGSVEADVNWGRARANARLNPDTSNATNKRVMREKFAEAGVPMPPLVNVGTDTFTEGSALVGRPDRHSKGRGLWLCRSPEDVAKALAGTRRKKAATHFMEYIDPERAPREYRCHIFQGKSIRISRKEYAEDKTWTAVKPGDVRLGKVREASRMAVAALGLDFGAVDVLTGGERNENVWVLEVNTAPGLGGSMPALYVRTFTQWKESLS